MAVDAKSVAELREMTGAGMMDAKRALEETGGDMAKAAEELRKKGIAKAAKRAERETKEGRVHAYIHANGKLGALIEVQCETDFVARTDLFIELCNDFAMQVCATDPAYLTKADVPLEVVEKEKAAFRGEDALQGKPEQVLEKIIEGKMSKFYSEVVLMNQSFVKEEEKTMEEYLKEKISTIGENIQITRFSRFQIM